MDPKPVETLGSTSCKTLEKTDAAVLATTSEAPSDVVCDNCVDNEPANFITNEDNGRGNVLSLRQTHFLQLLLIYTFNKFKIINVSYYITKLIMSVFKVYLKSQHLQKFKIFDHLILIYFTI